MQKVLLGKPALYEHLYGFLSLLRANYCITSYFRIFRKSLVLQKLNPSKLVASSTAIDRGKFILDQLFCFAYGMLQLVTAIEVTMSVHRYLMKISSKLPDPNGPLSKEMPAEAIKAANDSIEEATRNIGTIGK